MFVKAGTDKRTGKPLLVRDPVTMQPLGADGAEVPRTAYWLRRLRDGDVVMAVAAANDDAEPPEAA